MTYRVDSTRTDSRNRSSLVSKKTRRGNRNVVDAHVPAIPWQLGYPAAGVKHNAAGPVALRPALTVRFAFFWGARPAASPDDPRWPKLAATSPRGLFSSETYVRKRRSQKTLVAQTSRLPKPLALVRICRISNQANDRLPNARGGRANGRHRQDAHSVRRGGECGGGKKVTWFTSVTAETNKNAPASTETSMPGSVFRKGFPWGCAGEAFASSRTSPRQRLKTFQREA